MHSKEPPTNSLQIAIIGGGIAGLTLALGLLARGITTTVYERSASLREIGAGIGFTPNAERAMHVLDARIHAAFKRVTVQNGTDWFMWVDGSYQGGSNKRLDQDTLIHRMYLGERGFEGCHRADFLDELFKMMGRDTVQFCRNLESVVELGCGEGVELRFTDGHSAAADVVVGCDGIRSRVRQLILGVNDPASYPTYTHKYAFRGLVPMSLAQPILGTEKTQTRHMYLGRNGHALTFPVAGGKMLNVVAFTTDSSPWPYPDNFTAPVAKLDVVKAFASFNSTVRAIIDLLPDQLNKWAVFDTYDHPAPTFLKGSVCIAGDAAHASAPYHGAGAGFAIEDGAVLAQLLDRAGSSIGIDRSRAIHAALETYDAVRRERAQWLVQSSRFVGEMYEWRDETIGDDPGRCAEEIEWRSRKIWDYDVEEMMSQADSAFEARVEALRGGETR